MQVPALTSKRVGAPKAAPSAARGRSVGSMLSRTSKGTAKAPCDGSPDLVEDRQIGPRKSQDFRVVA